MGTSGSYIQLKNRGFTVEELQKGLSMLTGEKKDPVDFEQQVRQLRGGNLSAQEQEILHFLSGVMMKQQQEKPPLAGFRADAEWLPLWVYRLCDGYILSSKDLGRLSELFQTPVLGIALYDSDVLFISYFDAAAGITFDCAKLPWEGYEEYDDQLYQTELPDALADLFPPERREALRELWEREDEEKDATDWMDELLALLDTDFIDPIAEYIPQGFEIVRPD